MKSYELCREWAGSPKDPAVLPFRLRDMLLGMTFSTKAGPITWDKLLEADPAEHSAAWNEVVDALEYMAARLEASATKVRGTPWPKQHPPRDQSYLRWSPSARQHFFGGSLACETSATKLRVKFANAQ